MIISLENISKKYQKEWIIRDYSYQFTNDSYLISGPNGSGKSTLLKLISGFLTPTSGNIIHKVENKKINPDNIYKHIAYTGPYIDVFEEYTLKELTLFYSSLKSLKVNDVDLLEDIIGLTNIRDKPIKNFSSGMKQRVKLVLAILSDTEVLLLDEPTSYLDNNAIKWYQDLILQHVSNRIVIVASNNSKEDAFFCKNRIDLELTSF